MEQSKGLVLSSSTKILDAVTLWQCSIREETRTGGAVLVTFRPPYIFPKRVSTNASFIYAHCYVPLHGISELRLLITAVSTSAITTRRSHRNPEEWVSVLPFSLMRPHIWCFLWWFIRCSGTKFVRVCLGATVYEQRRIYQMTGRSGRDKREQRQQSHTATPNTKTIQNE